MITISEKAVKTASKVFKRLDDLFTRNVNGHEFNFVKVVDLAPNNFKVVFDTVDLLDYTQEQLSGYIRANRTFSMSFARSFEEKVAEIVFNALAAQDSVNEITGFKSEDEAFAAVPSIIASFDEAVKSVSPAKEVAA